MVVGAHPGPQLDRLVAVDTEEVLQFRPDLAARAPQLRRRRRQLGQYMLAHPGARLLVHRTADKGVDQPLEVASVG